MKKNVYKRHYNDSANHWCADIDDLLVDKNMSLIKQAD